MPGSGVTLDGAVTNALPPPVSVGDAEAAGPITATEPPPCGCSGRVLPLFLGRTVPVLATLVPIAWSACVVTTVLVVPVGGLLNSLKRNISRTIRRTIWLSVAVLT